MEGEPCCASGILTSRQDGLDGQGDQLDGPDGQKGVNNGHFEGPDGHMVINDGLLEGPDGPKEAKDCPNLDKYKDRAQRMIARYCTYTSKSVLWYIYYYTLFTSLFFTQLLVKEESYFSYFISRCSKL
jgi:hypothetical protein